MISLTTFYSWIAPILAPVTPAFMFGNNLYRGMLADGFDTNVAIFASVAGTIGVEASGAFACSMGVKAFKNRDKTILFIAVVCAVIYGVFVYVGISSVKNSQTFGSAVVISLVAYVMLGVYQDYLDHQKQVKDDSKRLIDEMTAQRLLNNSEARKIKAANASAPQANKDEQETNGSRTFASLSESERLFILNSGSKKAAAKFKVTPRAIQKWRKKMGSETEESL